jgi:predicted dehydrogenase
MRQIIQSFKSGELWLAEVPAPICQKSGAVIQTSCSFVSAGTERMLVDFAKKNILGKAMAMPDQVKKVLRKMKTEGVMSTIQKVQAKLDQPIPLGYSCAGIVEETGFGLEGISAGDRVACGGAGYANHAEYNFVPKNLIVKIPDNVSFEDASCATVGSIALQGVRQCDLRLGETVCVIGLGLLGVLAVQMLKASGCRVIGFDPNPERCKLSKELGADFVVADDLEAACMNFSEGRGVDAVLVTAATKSNEPVTVAGAIARHKGKVVVTGMVGMDIPRDQYYKKELDFKLSLSYGPGRYDPAYEENGNDYPFGYVRWTEQRNMQAFLEMVSAGTVTPSKLVTHRFDIDDALDAYDLLLGKTNEPYLGVVLNYSPKALGKIERKAHIEVKNKAVSGKPCIGMIGCGNFTKSVLLPMLKKQDIVLNGLSTATGMNCGETAKKEGFAYAATDYQELLKDEKINTVFVTTRHNTHAQIVSEALAVGKNVFVEKPLAINAEQLEQLCNVRKRTQAGIIMAGFNRRFSPHAKLIKEYFNGRQTPMQINYRINAGFVARDIWLQNPEIGGGRIIGEVCHFIDFASYLTGHNVVEVQAMSIDTSNSALTAQDNISINLKYSDGSFATIFYTALGANDLPKEYCEVYSDNSVAILNDYRSTICKGKRGKAKLSGAQTKGFAEEITAFVEAVRDGNDSPISWESLINTTAATFGVHKALSQKQLIAL